MFLLRKPSIRAIEAFLASQQKEKFAYSEVGATRSQIPSGYKVDHNRVRVGRGTEVYRRAGELLSNWRMSELGWVKAFPERAAIEPGVTVAVLAHHFGFWSLNASRIIYVLREERRFGFAYGTLHDHVEQGEERFSIEWAADDWVWYDIFAFSRPRQWQANLARPISRMLQKRFARDSMTVMSAAIRN